MESTDSLNDVMFLFGVFQNGLIFTALVAGLVCIGHVIYCRAVICRNAALFLTVILTGFSHLIICVYFLEISENTAAIEIPRGGHQHCTDYQVPATLANTIILTSIVHNIIRQNISSKIVASVVWVLSVGSIVLGLIGVVHLTELDPPDMVQDTFLTIGSDNEPQLNVFWSVCEKNVCIEKYRLLAEYGLIYMPVILIVGYAWFRACREKEDSSLFDIKIVEKNCCEHEDDFCICSKLGPTFVAILAYSTVILLIARPVMIVYARATSGYYRDILPSLLITVMYCFLCSEYLSKTFKIKSASGTKIKIEKDSLDTNIV